MQYNKSKEIIINFHKANSEKKISCVGFCENCPNTQKNQEKVKRREI